MYQPKLFFLLATPTILINTKNVSKRFYIQTTFHSTKRFRRYDYHFNFKRTITTNYNFQNVSSTFVFQPSQKNQNKYHQTSEIFPAIPEEKHHIDDDHKPSLMILIGWWNCKPKNLRKYISLYTEKFHIDTLSHIPPFYHVFFPWKIPINVNRLAKELIRIWVERGKPDNIGFHVFSDNGTYQYALLCEAIRQLSRSSSSVSLTPSADLSSSSNPPPSKPPTTSERNIFIITDEEAESFLNSIKSCVIDSAPSPISEKYIALGIAGGFTDKLALLKPKITSNDPSTSTSTSTSSSPNDPTSSSLSLSFLMSCLSLFLRLPVVKKYQDIAHSALDDIPGGMFDGRNIKYLFLYGPGDRVIPEYEVLRFMEKLKNRDKICGYSENTFYNSNKNEMNGSSGSGEKDEKNEEKKEAILRIVSKRFNDDSGHVQHFMKYPEEYINALKSFYELK